MDKYKGKGDPIEYKIKFKYSYYIISNDEILMLMTFPMNLAGQDLNWYNKLPQHCMYSFEKLINQILDQFPINVRKEIQSWI